MPPRFPLLCLLAFFFAACSDDRKGDDGALTARIVEPNGNATILKSTAVRLRAAFADGSAEVTPDDVSWTTSVPTDVIPQTNPADNVVLSEGQHIITVKGSLGKKTGESSITLTVGDVGVEIVRPTNNRQVAPGDSVTLQGEATTRVAGNQVNLNPTNSTFAWDADGVVFGANQNTLQSPSTLALGEHTITLTVSYADVATASVLTGKASIVLNVNTPPNVSVTAPNCPLDLEAGATQVFAGVAVDPEDGALTGSWLDLLTDASEDGDMWTYTTNVIGKHQIVYAATDSSDATGKDTCDVRVFPAGGSVASIFPNTSAVSGAMPNDDIEVTYLDGSGNLLAGSHGQLAVFDNGLALINDGGGASNPYDGSELGVGGGATVRDVLVLGGKLFAATADGLAECAYSGGNLSSCNDLGNGGDFNGLASYGDLAFGAVVASSSVDGLFLATYTGGNITASRFYDRDVLTTRDEIRDVLFVGAALYVATDSGVCVIDNPTTAAASQASSLCDSVIELGAVRTLAVSGSTLWAGTDQGLTGQTIGGTSSITYSRDDGLPDNNVNDIAIDGDGIVWVATDNGVGRLAPSTGNIVTLRPPDWNGSDQVNSVVIAPDGSKWFGTDQGVVHYVGA